jgi:NADP-dependent 3-hydroxy acid dehydrogenase YdfG
MAERLDSTVALITGASSGIGDGIGEEEGVSQPS